MYTVHYFFSWMWGELCVFLSQMEEQPVHVLELDRVEWLVCLRNLRKWWKVRKPAWWSDRAEDWHVFRWVCTKACSSCITGETERPQLAIALWNIQHWLESRRQIPPVWHVIFCNYYNYKYCSRQTLEITVIIFWIVSYLLYAAPLVNKNI